jgi:hypothetical protein
MSTLATLKLVTTKKPQNLAPVVLRRNKLSNRLWEQIQFAKSQAENTKFEPVKYRTITDAETGLRKQIQVSKRIKPWWFVAENGKVCVSIKYGSWTIELAKGKPSVEVATAGDLIKTLETIKTAVEAGELDAQLDLASNSLRSGFKK